MPRFRHSLIASHHIAKKEISALEFSLDVDHTIRVAVDIGYISPGWQGEHIDRQGFVTRIEHLKKVIAYCIRRLGYTPPVWAYDKLKHGIEPTPTLQNFQFERVSK